MLLSLLVTAALAAQPGPGAATAPLQVASPGFSLVNVDPKAGAFFADHFAQELGRQRGLSVMTASDVGTLIGMERQRQLLGCSSEGSSCLAEVAGALGVDAVITGSVARFEQSYRVNVKVLRARDGQALFLESTRAANEEALLDWLSRTARAAAPRMLEGLGRADAGLAQAGGGAGLSPWLPAAGGGALLVGGGVLYGLARGLHADLARGEPLLVSPAELSALQARGQAFQVSGLALGAAGVAGLVLSGVLALQQSAAPATPSVALGAGPGGAGMVVVQGVLP
jgi:hypothetical protein